MIAFVFAGQGVEPPWIDPALVARTDARPLLDAASAITGVDVVRALVRGDAALERLEVMQPAFVAACLVATRALDARPDIVCGHSLGELVAVAAGGWIDPIDAIAIAATRGRLMAREAARHPGGMAAVAPELVERALASGVTVAAENAPTERVVTGPLAAIKAVVAELRCKRLPVTGAWHSSLIAGAVAEYRAALAAVPWRDGATFVANFDGEVATRATIIDRLAGQLVHPVRFTRVLSTLRALGATRFVIPGPARLVRALIRGTLGDVEIRT